MKINEIFFSIQGESSFSGQTCIFIRTTYCNLRCTYCDTKYAYHDGNEMSISEIMDKIKTYPCKLVEITGGEPLLQQDINVLANTLLKDDYTVLCETSGSLDVDLISNKVHRIFDIKTPDSGESDKMHWASIDKLTSLDEVKFVICSLSDYRWAKEIIQKYDLIKYHTVLMSAEHDNMNKKDLVEWILADGLNVRFQVQLHKYIWSADTIGV
jgi:7-carboxy-7-deazaguanine synthase